jgi:SAM-dependent methyltransferase
MKCKECGLIYSNPRPVPEELDGHYGVAPEEYWRPEYFGTDVGHLQYYTDKFRQLWCGKRAPRALDVGAGVGKMMAAFERHGFDVFGLEPSREFREGAIANGIAADRLQLAAIENAHYEPHTFDFVCLSAVLEHVHNPAAVIERALTWTTRGGLLFVEVPSARWLLGRLLNLAYRAQGLDYVTNLSPMHPPYHLYEFTLESFARHSRRAAYEIVEHRFHPCETFLPRGASAIATKLMAATSTGMVLHVWLRAAS